MAAIAQRDAKPRSGAVVGPKTATGRAVQVIALVVLIIFALLMFVPFAFSLATSFKTPPEAANLTFENMFWPNEPTLQAYRTAFDSNIARWFFNSAFVALCWIVGRAI